MSASIPLVKASCYTDVARRGIDVYSIEFRQAVTACELTNAPRPMTRPPKGTVEIRIIKEEAAQPDKEEAAQPDKEGEPPSVISTSQRVSSGTWVRVSPNRWQLQRD
jgi:hypothetical protein